MPLDIMHMQERMGEVALVETDPRLNSAASMLSSWLEDPTRFEMVKTLKDMALGNCRLLYGSERMKFYDIVISIDEDNQLFCAVLVCSKDLASKFLRKSISDCPVKAVRAIVASLQKDTALLFTKYDTGSTMTGQQGYTNKETGKWELAVYKQDNRIDRPDDDTETLMGRSSGRGGDFYIPSDAPRGPRAGNKRARANNNDRMVQADDSSILEYGEPML